MNDEILSIQSWLKEPPFDNPDALLEKSDFSYEEWFDRGRKLPKVVEILIKLLNENLNKNIDLSIRIIYAMGWVGDKRCEDVLLSALNKKDSNIKTEAVSALGRLKVESAYDKILPLLMDKNEDTNVRANACIAIGSFATPNSKTILSKFKNDPDLFVAKVAEEGIKLITKQQKVSS